MSLSPMLPTLTSHIGIQPDAIVNTPASFERHGRYQNVEGDIHFHVYLEPVINSLFTT
jgi:hypothetical protein